MRTPRQHGWGHRAIGFASTLALGLAFLPATAGPASADHLIDLGPACDNAPASDLDDADATSTPPDESDVETVIDCLSADEGWTNDSGTPVLTGTTGNEADFDSLVTRAQFSGIFNRIGEAGGVDTQESTETPFEDIEGRFFEPDIRAIFGEAWTEGTSETTYSPSNPLATNQLATFYVRMIEDVTGQVLPTTGTERVTAEDFGGFHRQNGEKLYDAGILTESQADAGQVQATRGDIFGMAARTLSYFVQEGVAANPFTPTNQSFAMTPQDGADLEWGQGRDHVLDTTRDQEHRIALFPAENVTIEGSAVVTFEDVDDDGLADGEADTTAEITSVNGTTVSADDERAAVPVNGRITFTIEDDQTEQVHAVVYVDGNGNGNLDVDQDGKPVAEELFGAAGRTNWIPQEAAEGIQVAGTVTLVDDDGDFAALNDSDTVYFDRVEDTYRILGSGGFYEATSSADFLRQLTIDDALRSCTGSNGAPGPYTPSTGTEWCLDDNAPVPPANVAAQRGEDTDSTIDVTWDDSVTPGVDAYLVHLNDEACDSTDVSELAQVGSVRADAENAFTATGLAADTTHCVVVSAKDGEDTSAFLSDPADTADPNTDQATTSAPVVEPTIEQLDLENDEVTEGIADAGDAWEFTFSETMAADSVADLKLSLTDVDGDTFRVECTDDSDTVTDATCTLETLDIGNGDGTNGNFLVVTLAEDAIDRNAAGDGQVEYPSTVTAMTGLTDDDDPMSEVDLGASDDTVVDVPA